jgi:hypothetical protein
MNKKEWRNSATQTSAKNTQVLYHRYAHHGRFDLTYEAGPSNPDGLHYVSTRGQPVRTCLYSLLTLSKSYVRAIVSTFKLLSLPQHSLASARRSESANCFCMPALIVAPSANIPATVQASFQFPSIGPKMTDCPATKVANAPMVILAILYRELERLSRSLCAHAFCRLSFICFSKALYCSSETLDIAFLRSACTEGQPGSFTPFKTAIRRSLVR